MSTNITTNSINSEEIITDIEGRVSKLHLPPSKCLLPLFEAIVNSIHSIEDKQNLFPEFKGNIDIFITRERENTENFSLSLFEGDLRPIQGFTIVDNGIGFDSENYRFFKQSDTTHKKDKGGQGIGRFLWLKAFNKVRIYSKYRIQAKFDTRQFSFMLPNGINMDNEKEYSNVIKDTGAVIELIDFNKEYFGKCSSSKEIIAQKITEHCLVYFISQNCPQINLISDGEKINLNSEFEKIERFEPVTFFIKDEKFNLYHLKLETADEKHCLHMCAHSRDVDEIKLETMIPCLNRKIKVHNEMEKKEYYYKAYLSGKYLDDKVNGTRTDFNFKEAKISQDEIKKETKKYILEFLKNDLIPLQDNTYSEMQKLTNTELFEYKHILKYKSNEIRNLPQGIAKDKNKAKIELMKLYIDSKIELEEEGTKLFKRAYSEVNSNEDYQALTQKYTEKLNDFTKHELAKYVVHRNLILKLLDQCLDQKEDGTYSLEEAIHNLIFPMGNTSNDIDNHDQNLWVIDERMSYHKYLASDIPVTSQDPTKNNHSRKEPDITIYNLPFDKAIAYSQESEDSISSIFIIEFKKPEGVRYNIKTEDPVQQVINYVNNIKYGNIKDSNGRSISKKELADKNIPFYAYIICDCLDETFKEIVDQHDLEDTPDQLGYFRFHKKYNTYIEVISYKKLLRDAKRRNRILFEKLGLPVN